METDSGQRAMSRRREGAKERREWRLRAEARIRLQLCRDAVRIESHRGGDGCRRAHTDAFTQTAPVAEPPVTEFCAAPALVIKYVAPALDVTYAAPAPAFDFVAPAPVIECIAPARVVPSFQLPPPYTMGTVTARVNLDVSDLVNPQFSTISVEASAPGVGSLLLSEGSAAPVRSGLSGTDRCRGDDTEHREISTLCRNR